MGASTTIIVTADPEDRARGEEVRSLLPRALGAYRRTVDLPGRPGHRPKPICSACGFEHSLQVAGRRCIDRKACRRRAARWGAE